MIPGVNFQPGAQGYGEDPQVSRRPQSGSNQGVQEAIKVLSLRLPKVVGARSVAPPQLLTSQGSGGNPNVDSIVESVLSRMFPGQNTGGAPSAPMFNPAPSGSQGAPSPALDRSALGNWWDQGDVQQPKFTGSAAATGFGSSPQMPRAPLAPLPTTPNITVGVPTDPKVDVTLDPNPTGAGVKTPIEEAPDLRRHFDWLSPPEPQSVPLI